MAVFRIEKTRDYTVMANHHLKNRELTLKAKGLMSVMLSLPDNWDYTLVGLSRISREGVDAIREAIKELEHAGYVIRSRIRNEKGQLTDTEYVIYEQPRVPEVAADHQQPDSPALDKPALENPTLEHPVLESPVKDKPTVDSPTLENPMQLNTHRLNTHREKIDLSIPHAANTYPSIPQSSTPAREQPSTVAQYKALVQHHIDYENMCQQYERERLDEIVYLIVEVLCSKAQFFTINGNDVPAELVRSQLLKFNSLHLQHVFDCLNKISSSITNIKAYLLTTLYNAVSTHNSYYDARVRHDHPYLFSKEV